MKAGNPNVIVSLTATEAITKCRFVAFDGKHTVDKKAIGVSIYDTDSGDPITLQAGGIAVVEAGDAVTAGACVKSDADGKAVALAYPTDTAENLAAAIQKLCGVALDTASDAGDFIRVVLK